MKRIRPDALLLVALLAFGGYAAFAPTPRSAVVIPSGVSSGGLSETDQLRSGAPDPSPTGAGSTTLSRSARPTSVPSPSGAPPSMTAAPPPVAAGATVRPRTVRPSGATPTRVAQRQRQQVQDLSSAGSNPAPSTTIRAAASWYDDGSGIYAAAHGYIDGSRVVVLIVSIHDGRTFSVTAPIRTQCAVCRWAPGVVAIDLSPAAFLALGYPLARGIAPVTVSVVEGSL